MGLTHRNAHVYLCTQTHVLGHTDIQTYTELEMKPDSNLKVIRADAYHELSGFPDLHLLPALVPQVFSRLQ
jgi:hypothetical protein